MKKVLLVVAHVDFQPKEYFDTKAALEQAGLEVVTASNLLGEATAKDGTKIPVAQVLESVDPTNFDGIFLIGGPGALEHLDNQETNRVLNECMIAQKPYGAICISPRILAKAHVLVGKKSTGWDGDQKLAEIFAQNNVEYVREPVVVDGIVVTANGPEAARAFGEAIVTVLA